MDNFVEKSLSPYVRVAVPGPFWKGLDYILPAECSVSVGSRVKVSLGRREVVGVVEALLSHSEFQDRLKPILAVVDAEVLLSASFLGLIRWVADYYCYPLGDTLGTALPKAILTGRPLQPKLSKKALSAGSSSHPLRQAGEGRALSLNPEQQAALSKIALDHFQVYLLEGVTGSGKTEVYLQLIEKALQQGSQVLVLVPEIGLTPQTLERFEARFSVPIVSMHSGLTDTQQHKSWYLAFSGQASIVIGTRSAVFMPLPKLGLIVIDEEHDLSYKQQVGLKYSAKDVAIKRAQLLNIPILLGSATPALESLYHAKISHKFTHLCLTQRAGAAQMPKIYVIDIRQQALTGGISKPLLQACEAHLKQGGQVLLFLNRRGYAPVLLCHHCGWKSTCPNCERYHTVHLSSKSLICHHCLESKPLMNRCPACTAGEDLIQFGVGTERIEEALKASFPEYSVLRIDRSSTSQKGQLSDFLAQGHAGSAHILVGTQMLAKGHHFSKLTMVGVIDVDASLFSSDFRALERVGQLLVQVAGRAGREDKVGEVYLQTHEPTHPLLNLLLKEGYPAFAAELLKEREAAEWPPFSYLALLKAEGPSKQEVEAFLRAVKASLPRNSGVQVLGPLPALLAKKANQYRMQLLFQCRQRGALHQSLRQCLESLTQQGRQKVRWSLDIDPQEVL